MYPHASYMLIGKSCSTVAHATLFLYCGDYLIKEELHPKREVHY